MIPLEIRTHRSASKVSGSPLQICSLLIGLLIIMGGILQAQEEDRASSGQAIPRGWYQAAEEGDLNRIKKFYRQGVDVDSGNGRALRLAAKHGHEQVVRFLLEKDASVDARGSNGRTALTVASGRGHLEVVRKLIRTGADVNREGDYGRSLYQAAQNGSPRVVSALLDAGAKVDLKSGANKHTALSRAAMFGNTKCMKKLIEAGANVNVLNAQNKSPLYMAAHGVWGGDGKTMRTLLENGSKLDPNSKDEISPLEISQDFDPREGNRDIIKVLVRAGADLTRRDLDGNTPLMNAVRNENPEVVRLMIQHGANIHAQNKNGNTALHMAADGGCSPEIFKTLLEAGAKLTRNNKKGRTPVQLAERTGCRPTLRLLETYRLRKFIQSSFDPLKKTLEKNVQKYIQQLSAREYDRRQQATKKLLEMGEGAMYYLKKHLDHPDPEARMRVQVIIRMIAERHIKITEGPSGQ